MALGTCVHKTIEKIHPQLESTGDVDLARVTETYKHVWSSEVEKKDTVIFSRDRDLNWYYDKGLDGIKWYTENYEYAGSTIFGELGLEFEIDGVKFIAKPDRVTTMGTGKYLIHDYKTSSSPPTPYSLKSDRQLPMYQYALQNSVDGVEEVELIWHYVCLHQNYRAIKKDHEVRSVVESLLHDVQHIETTEEFTPSPSALCHWCLYWDKCPAKGFKQRKIIARHVVD